MNKARFEFLKKETAKLGANLIGGSSGLMYVTCGRYANTLSVPKTRIDKHTTITEQASNDEFLQKVKNMIRSKK